MSLIRSSIAWRRRPICSLKPPLTAPKFLGSGIAFRHVTPSGAMSSGASSEPGPRPLVAADPTAAYRPSRRATATGEFRENARDRKPRRFLSVSAARKPRRRRADADPEPPRAAERAQYRAHRGVARGGRACRGGFRVPGAFSSPAPAEGFCAGADLTDRALGPGAARPDLGQALENGLNPLVRALRGLPKPVVCAVNGPAAGAGANLALACDIVLAAKSAQFLQAFARIGLIPDAGGTFTLPRLVGEARARALMMLAEPIGAEQAEAWGMIYRAVEDEDLMGEARTHRRTPRGRTDAHVRPHQARAHRLANASLDAQLDLERDLQREAGRTGRICRRRAGVSGEAASQFRRRPDTQITARLTHRAAGHSASERL